MSSLMDRYGEKLLTTPLALFSQFGGYEPPQVEEALMLVVPPKIRTTSSYKDQQSFYTEADLIELFDPKCTYCGGEKLKRWHNHKANKFLAQWCGVCQ